MLERDIKCLERQAGRWEGNGGHWWTKMGTGERTGVRTLYA